MTRLRQGTRRDVSETSASGGPAPKRQPRVGLFVTCLVDITRPTVGFAAVKLLEDAGCKVVVPAQTCYGQPAYSGEMMRHWREREFERRLSPAPLRSGLEF
jgi:Fe-S oxidoreductase